MENVKVLNATAIPITPSVGQTMNETVKIMNETLNSFAEDTKEAKANSILHDFHNYVKSDQFKSDINEASKKYNVPPKKLAQNFFGKVLGTVGDILGVAINVICNGGRMIINILGTIANGIIDFIHTIANGLASIVTLNKTCVA
jgi:hypothetical protein